MQDSSHLNFPKKCAESKFATIFVCIESIERLLPWIDTYKGIKRYQEISKTCFGCRPIPLKGSVVVCKCLITKVSKFPNNPFQMAYKWLINGGL